MTFPTLACNQHSKFETIFDNYAEAEATLKWIRSLDGVNKVKMGIMKEPIFVQNWLDEEVAERLA